MYGCGAGVWVGVMKCGQVTRWESVEPTVNYILHALGVVPYWELVVTWLNTILAPGGEHIAL